MTDLKLRQIGKALWEIPRTGGMRVPARIYATPQMIEHIRSDNAPQQAANVAHLPGIVKASLAMPDIHWGYGFPIGGVAAFDLDEGVISPGGVGYDINCLSGQTDVLHQHGYTRRIDDMAETWHDASLACFRLDAPAGDTARPVRWFGRPPQAPLLRLTTQTGASVEARPIIPSGRRQA